MHFFFFKKKSYTKRKKNSVFNVIGSLKMGIFFSFLV
jgi:hypothetical protein